jgi:hypothetical protein
MSDENSEAQGYGQEEARGLRHASGDGTGATRTSENTVNTKFAES